jgi:hypothetical protein
MVFIFCNDDFVVNVEIKAIELDPEETNPESYYDLVTDLERNPFLTITTDVKKLKKWLEPNFYDMFIDSNDQSG